MIEGYPGSFVKFESLDLREGDSNYRYSSGDEWQ